MTEPTLTQVDPEIASLIQKEEQRQLDVIRLIASENYASRAVTEAAASVLNNKYSEGYPGKRYYQGQANIDAIESLCIERIKKLFGVEHANVQPYSGSPANLAVHYAFLRPGDKTVGLGLPAGGHLTHGWKVSITGDFFSAHQYGVRESDHRIDMDQVAALVKEHKPKLIWCGTTAYPRTIDFAAFAQIARDAGAILAADIAHISGLVAGGAHPSPVGFADIITSTTHKTLRGPRGGMILTTAKHAAAIDKAVFPGLQGGPHNSAIAGLAVAAHEALQPSFKVYAKQIVDNAKALAEALMSRDVTLVTGGTDNHLILADLTSKNVSGKKAAVALEAAGIVCNYNSVPFDKRKPFDPSGIRIGTPSITSRGMTVADMKTIGNWMADVIEAPEDTKVHERVKTELLALTAKYPAPGLAR
ncbi:MAG: serine hydroxymethyltransferase [Deltaproteobacteria bacterium]|nr:serine hydroxymethyltransferase [Deltaproteobacteria bacterium]